MAHVTLFLTRKPVTEFTEAGGTTTDTTGWKAADVQKLHGWSKQPTFAEATANPVRNGIWSTLGVLEGPKVLTADYRYGSTSVPRDYVQMAEKKAADAGREFRTIEFSGFPLLYETPKGAPEVASFKEYSAAERYRSDFGGIGGGGWEEGYIILHPQPTMPYTLGTDPNNPVVKTLRAGHRGNCLRIIAGIPAGSTPRDKQRAEQEAAILIHECPSVGWVVGCVGPRPKGDRRVYANADGNPSYQALNEIYDLVNRAGGTASLIVLDWG